MQKYINLNSIIALLSLCIIIAYFNKELEKTSCNHGNTESEYDQNEEEMIKVMKVSLKPNYQDFKRTIIEDPAKEYQERLDRIKRVCKNYTDSGWYQSNILPEEYNTLEDWIRSKKYSAEEIEKIKADRENMKELKLGGMDYNELKLQIEPVHKLMYCDLPKAGSSVWMKIMLFLSKGTAWKGGNVHKESMVQNSFLYSYLPDDQMEMLKSHYKFMFVRHPFERLLSGFRNKVSHIGERTFDKNVWVEIHKGNQFEMEFGKDAKVNLDLTKYNAASQMLDIESFHTFIHYLIARGPGGDHDGKVWDTRQKHWRRVIDVCKVCSIDWDFIGKTEYFNDDHNWMFKNLGILDKIGMKTDDRSVYGQNHFYQYYEGLSKETIKKLYELYRPDFELFGYEVPEGLL